MINPNFTQREVERLRATFVDLMKVGRCPNNPDARIECALYYCFGSERVRHLTTTPGVHDYLLEMDQNVRDVEGGQADVQEALDGLDHEAARIARAAERRRLREEDAAFAESKSTISFFNPRPPTTKEWTIFGVFTVVFLGVGIIIGRMLH